jgi:hypothetical protein
MDKPGFSLAKLADHLLWSTNDGKPNKSKVQRMMADLVKAKLVENDQGNYILTKKGREKIKKPPISTVSDDDTIL